jgi:hypothetical protein
VDRVSGVSADTACPLAEYVTESEFTALRYFGLNGTDHRGHAEQADRSPEREVT